ncbi:hypothetical protein E4T56_gene4085, partial [Termitomyces sp. T112]
QVGENYARELFVALNAKLKDEDPCQLQPYQFIPSVLNNITNGTTITFRFTGAPGNHGVTHRLSWIPVILLPVVSTLAGLTFLQTTLLLRQNGIWLLPMLLVVSILVILSVLKNRTLAGLIFLTNNASTSPEWNLTVTNATGPIWFFCMVEQSASIWVNPVQQEEGSLVGAEASASAGPGPSSSGIIF